MSVALESLWRAAAMLLAVATACAQSAPRAADARARLVPGISFARARGVEAGVARQGGAGRGKIGVARPALVGNISDGRVYEGCGCHWQLPSERRARTNRYFFKADGGRRAWMNIGGRDVELRLVGASHMSLKSRRGQRMDFRFRGAGGIRVRVRMLVTRTSTYETDYEPGRYAVVVEAAKGRRRQVVTLKGETCGC